MFRYDGKIFEVINKLFDVIVIGILWFIMSIPIITIGASTTAAYYVAFNILNGKDGYVLRNFFKSFKLNFIQSTIIFLIVAVASAVVSLNIYLLVNGIIANGTLRFFVFILQLVIIFEIYILNYYGLALLSKVEFTTKSLITTAIMLGNKHLLITILNIVIFIAVGLATGFVPIFILFAGGAYILLSASLMRKVLIQYRPEAFEELQNDDNSFRINLNENEDKNNAEDISNLKEK